MNNTLKKESDKLMMHSFEEFQKIVKKFVQDREWEDFHNPKDLAIAISVESGELLELFRFKDYQKIRENILESEFRERVGEELADIFIFGASLANNMDLKIESLIMDKLQKNEKKYNIEEIREYNQKLRSKKFNKSGTGF